MTKPHKTTVAEESVRNAVQRLVDIRRLSLFRDARFASVIGRSLLAGGTVPEDSAEQKRIEQVAIDTTPVWDRDNDPIEDETKSICHHKSHHRGCPGDCYMRPHYNPFPLLDPRTVEGDPEYLAALDDLRELHLLKSGGYGTGYDRFANFTLVASAIGEPRHRYPRRRMLEKIARLESLDAQGRTDELEEEYLDIAGLAMCCLAVLRKDGNGKGAQ